LRAAGEMMPACCKFAAISILMPVRTYDLNLAMFLKETGALSLFL
jgi:hypothetical protein